ncbi:MAG: enoyl-CoA hydratase/isomerase family protein [Gammaproteobacteria bacterium]|nr:enoyl-CoA hydratase/isomerase family protein [Gammaproteobacteria bacterium]MCP5458277.1 enoyl-CoA hydratase/isomerase family protein [Gammaproteobacteria bacterium]
MQVVSFSKLGQIGLITIDNPPVNALSQAVRAGLKEAVTQGIADSDVKAMVVICAGRTFAAGADIREFETGMKEPFLPPVLSLIENSDKPVIAALHGTALGGGMELALGCHFRVAVGKAKIGLPEVKLGILPGAGGTQRLPRLIGAEAALKMIAEGNPISASQAKTWGAVDEIIEGDLKEGAIAFAEKVLAEKRPLRRASQLTAKVDDPDLFERYTSSIAVKQRGFLAPFNCIKAVRAATELPFEQGVERERALFLELVNSPQSKAQRHVFFSEREVTKIPGLPGDTPIRDIQSIGVIGAGAMGVGIALCCANVGIPVVLLEMNQENLDRGLAVIRKTYAGSVGKGRLKQEDMDRRLALITPTLSYGDLSNADLVIEAVFEDLAVKKEVFSQLDTVCKPGAILATNTSYLNLNEIAAFTRRPQDVVGMHFFSPANVMKLLENVRGDKTAPDVLATAQAIGKKLGKLPVMVGVCPGFVGNRMFMPRLRESFFLLEEGASPQQIDQAMFDFGFPMGPLATADMAGLDIAWRHRKVNYEQLTPREQACNLLDKICELGRYGQKTGAGIYRYDERRNAAPDPLIEDLIVKHSAERGVTRRNISDQEILERCLYVMINEGAKILEEGVAARPLDIDMIWVFGYGFPVYRGGPMFYADQLGLATVYEALLRYQEQLGAEFWKPAPLLEKLAKEGKGFY